MKRERLLRVVEELNRSIGRDKNLFLELVRWETHVAPDMGRPQAVINRQIGPYDIFIGIMWKRFGTPTGTAESGTQEEFGTALESWRTTGRPRIMFYFNQSPYTLGTAEEVEQISRVLEFRRQLQREGLFWQYNGADEFEHFVREHLTIAVRALVASSRDHLTTLSTAKKETDSLKEPAQELFASAFSEWKRHRVFASRDRLELFLQNKDRIELTRDQLRFILESWFKSGEYSPENFVKSYDEKQVLELCTEIIKEGKDVDLTNGAIKVLGNQESVQCAETLLYVIENKKQFQDSSREVAIDRFWFSRVAKAAHARVLTVLINVLQTEANYKLRKEAAYALGNYPEQEVANALERALADPRSQVRANAIYSLGKLSFPSSIAPLLKALDQEKYSNKIRKKIIWALGHFSTNSRVREVLESIAASREEDSEIAREAKWTLAMASENYAGDQKA